MRTTFLVLSMTIAGMSGQLQAAKPHKPHPAHASQVHKVKKGETAVHIAKAHGLTMAEFSAINPRLDLKTLSVGMIVRVREAQQPFRRLNIPAHPAGFPPVHGPIPAMSPLPETPALGPATLVHLERVLPSEGPIAAPAPPASSERSAVGSAIAPSMAGLRPVLPQTVPQALPQAADVERNDEVVPPSLTGALGFEPADPAKLDLLWPVETRTVSSAWGPRMRSRTVKVKANRRRVHYRGSHKGVDLSAPKGADVFAAMDGQVVATGRHRQYGNFVVLDHGNGVVTLYAHHNRNFVKEGEIVRRGQKIAEVGRTGNATGPHLHFELRLEGLPQNPLPFLNDVEEIPAAIVAQNQAAVAPSSAR